MEMLNFSPFPNLRFYNTDNQGREFGVIVIKGTYAVAADGTLVIADEQAPLVLEDTYHGALNLSSLWLPSDLVPKKPRTDIILNAVARVPGAQPRREWTCGVVVEGGTHPFSKQLRVTGPRVWQPTWGVSDRALATLAPDELQRVFKGWVLSDPEPVSEVPIRYEHAYGGLLARRQEGTDEPWYDADEHNPIGCGWLDLERTPKEGPVPAPQIVDADAPALSPMQPAVPAGFGPIPPAWLPRRPLGGTFDAHWEANVWPNWPADYDFAYHNSANPSLIYPGFLSGVETIVLDGLDGGEASRRLVLPGHQVTAVIQGEGETRVMMDLDTLLLDVADPDPAEHRVFITWRATYKPDEVTGLALILPDDTPVAAVLETADGEA
jgi:hypothetical protein